VIEIVAADLDDLLRQAMRLGETRVALDTAGAP
jgi:hypothetical protein